MSAGASTIAILAYHKVGRVPDGGWETWFRVSEPAFVDQLAYLESEGWEALTVPGFLAALEAPETAPRRAVLITFDDAYRAVREIAMPQLERFGFPAVVFVPSDFIGSVNSFDAAVEPEEPICDWDDLSVLESAGISVQSHGASHRALSVLDPAERNDELTRSKATLEKGLAKQVELFAYPYGDGALDGGMHDSMRSAGYRAACLYEGGVANLPVIDAYRLPRIPIGSDTDLARELAAAG